MLVGFTASWALEATSGWTGGPGQPGSHTFPVPGAQLSLADCKVWVSAPGWVHQQLLCPTGWKLCESCGLDGASHVLSGLSEVQWVQASSQPSRTFLGSLLCLHRQALLNLPSACFHKPALTHSRAASFMLF